MIEPQQFAQTAAGQGVTFATGVPCSFLGGLFGDVLLPQRLRYVGATSEGEAIGIAAGAWLAGQDTVTVLQNSGLGNTVNPLTSLCHPFRIPTLMMVTWRGQPGTHDEPQHAVMGEITQALLATMRIRYAVLPEDPRDLAAALSEARASMRGNNLPYALIVPSTGFSPEPAATASLRVRYRGPAVVQDLRTHAAALSRFDALELMGDMLPNRTAVVATTGKCGRELFTLGDHERNLYLVGSMGCASAVGLGIALNTRRSVVVLDGDGAALMKLGNLATIGAEAPSNLIHLILDNGTYDSTGGQPTSSSTVNFAAVAAACAYQTAYMCDDGAGLRDAVTSCLESTGPHLVHLKIRPGSLAKLGRPTIPPEEVARRFRSFVSGS